MRLAASEAKAAGAQQGNWWQATRTREKEAAGPHQPHQARRCAKRQRPSFAAGAGAAAPSGRACNTARSRGRAARAVRCAAGQPAASTLLVVLKPDEKPMTNEELLRERVAKLEVEMVHLNEKLDDTHKKVEEMHAILLQAKGARWVIVGLAGVAGLASGLVAKLMP
jgi:hypothetical protein